MNKIFLALTVALLPAVAIPAVSNEAAIEQRQAAFKATKAAAKGVKSAMKAGDFHAARESAEKILSNAELVTDLFPEDSYEGDTRAKKKIWDNWDDFQQRQQKLVSDAEQLVAVSQSDDIGELKDAFKVLSKNCKGCHRKYRQIF
jgi:cytochrome c556